MPSWEAIGATGTWAAAAGTSAAVVVALTANARMRRELRERDRRELMEVLFVPALKELSGPAKADWVVAAPSYHALALAEAAHPHIVHRAPARVLQALKSLEREAEELRDLGTHAERVAKEIAESFVKERFGLAPPGSKREFVVFVEQSQGSHGLGAYEMWLNDRTVAAWLALRTRGASDAPPSVFASFAGTTIAREDVESLVQALWNQFADSQVLSEFKNALKAARARARQIADLLDEEVRGRERRPRRSKTPVATNALAGVPLRIRQFGAWYMVLAATGAVLLLALAAAADLRAALSTALQRSLEASPWLGLLALFVAVFLLAGIVAVVTLELKEIYSKWLYMLAPELMPEGGNRQSPPSQRKS